MLTPFHKMHGLSLIELMVAVLLFGILMTLGMSNFSTWIQNQQTRTAADAILNGLQLARGEAVKRNVSAMIVLCDVAAGRTGSSWDVLAASAAAISTACGADSSSATGWERVQQRAAQEGSRNAVVGVSGPTGANSIAFNGLGRVAVVPSLGLPPSANLIVQGTTTAPVTAVTLSNPKGDRSLAVTVGMGGSVRMCDPSSTLALTDPRHC